MILACAVLTCFVGDCVSARGGVHRVADVVIPSQAGGTLTARILAPDASLQTGPCPCITMLPGGGAPLSSVEWAAQALAQAGYVVLVTLPASGGSATAYNTAAKSGIDYLASAQNPFASSSDTTRIGAAGWSLGARTLSRTQEEDTRIQAIVAWDNLARSENGDEGSPACSFVPGTIRSPRAPAMGLASDTCATAADAKKVAFAHWRDAGVPCMEVVFAGATHFWWSASGTASQHADSNYYTQAWFDRWLKNLPDARDRLLARNVLGQNVTTLLSGLYRSAAWFDGVDCGDLRTECAILGSTYCTADANSSGIAARIAASGSASLGTNSLMLSAWRTPANSNAIFYLGTQTASAPFGNGTRCVGGSLVRLAITNTGPSGLFVFQPDFSTSPLAGVVTAGSSWNFQAYYRDALAGGANFDLSDAITVTLLP